MRFNIIKTDFQMMIKCNELETVFFLFSNKSYYRQIVRFIPYR